MHVACLVVVCLSVKVRKNSRASELQIAQSKYDVGDVCFICQVFFPHISNIFYQHTLGIPIILTHSSTLFLFLLVVLFCNYWAFSYFIYAYGAKLQIPTCYLIFSGIVQFFCLPEKKMSTCPRKNLLTMKKAHAYFIILMTDFYKSHRIGCILMIDWNTLTWCNSRKVAQSPVVADPLTMRMGIADWRSKTWTLMNQSWGFERLWSMLHVLRLFATTWPVSQNILNHSQYLSKYCPTEVDFLRHWSVNRCLSLSGLMNATWWKVFLFTWLF
mgnify:CR=1 FL=1